MKLVQLFLPLYDPAGKKISGKAFAETRRELLTRFGGLTSYSRAPAKGFWKGAGAIVRDDVIVFEIVLSRVERKWWRAYRGRLEARFRQEKILIRLTECAVL